MLYCIALLFFVNACVRYMWAMELLGSATIRNYRFLNSSRLRALSMLSYQGSAPIVRLPIRLTLMPDGYSGESD